MIFFIFAVLNEGMGDTATEGNFTFVDFEQISLSETILLWTTNPLLQDFL